MYNLAKRRIKPKDIIGNESYNIIQLSTEKNRKYQVDLEKKSPIIEQKKLKVYKMPVSIIAAKNNFDLYNLSIERRLYF